MAILKKLAPDWRTFAAAVLITLSFPPFDLPLIWIALVPWLIALDRASSKKAALVQGFWMSFFFTVGIQYWVTYALHESAAVPWPVCIAGGLIYALVGHPEFYVFAPIFRALTSPNVPKELFRGPRAVFLLILTALAFAGIDWAVPKLYNESVGHAFYYARNLRQAADVGGVPLLTFLVFIANQAALALYRWLRKRSELPFPLSRAGTAVFFMGAALLYGYFRNHQLEVIYDHPTRLLQTAVIQGNIDNDLRTAADQSEPGALTKITEHYLALSDRALSMKPSPTVIVWPESAYPSRFHATDNEEGRRMDEVVDNYVRGHGTPLIFGAPDFEGGLQYNSVFALTPVLSGPKELQIYHKSKLVPFGEYIPFSDDFPFLKTVFPYIINLGKGPGPDLIRISYLRILPAICYEILFPSHTLAGARHGAEVILNFTNDSWFGPYSAPYIHLALSTFRSIETRLPQLRATNTGITALILPSGEIVKPTTIFTEAVLNLSIPIYKPIPTLFFYWGEWFGPAALAVGLAGLLILRYVFVRRRERS